MRNAAVEATQTCLRIIVLSSLIEHFAAAAIYRILLVLFNDVWKRLAEAEDMTALRTRIYEYTP
jgi:hypothetical protein